jgi:predicted TPR repeat methyltransferase
MFDDNLFAPAPNWRRALPRLGLDENSPLPVARLAARLAAAGERAAAADAYRELLAEAPDDLDLLERLAAIVKRLGRREEEVALHRRIAEVTCTRLGVPAAEREAVIAFELAAIGVEETPATAPGSYIAASFDAMASYFDWRLRASLGYRGPEQIVERLARAHASGAATLDVCDAGCGTGLLGPLLRPYARTLTGVDLSPKMLEKARERGVYDALYTDEIVAHLGARTASYDVITAADVFVYIGDVAPVFAAAARALRSTGLFLFTAELADGDGYALALVGRYAHSAAYLRAAASGAGLAVLSMEEEQLRTERTKPVRALICALQLTAQGG